MKKIIYVTAFLGIILYEFSCTKILNQQPQSFLEATTAFTTKQSVEAGVIGIYDAFQSASYVGTDYTILPELEADNLNHTGSFTNYLEIKNRIITTSNFSVINIWNQIYTGINRANNVITSANNITDASFTNKRALTGEASLLRAYMYFDLLRFYGGDSSGYASATGLGVPLVLTPTYTSANAMPKARSGISEVITQILTDTDTAIGSLAVTSSNGRVNKNVALAFKARVLLYKENFTDAESYATQIIDQYKSSTIYGGLATNYASIYTVKNTKPESIWELQSSATDGNGIGFYYYGRSEIASSNELGAAHEAGDLRKTVNYNNTVSPTRYRSLKFTRTDNTDNIPLIRLAEVYLIRAEARIRKASPNITGALEDLNLVRARAGLGASTAATTTTTILTAVTNERRIELAHEGQRFFDLRRLGLAKLTLGITETYRLLWPLPQREVDVSAGLIKQNPNY